MATLFPYLFFELKCHSQYWPSYIISAVLIQTPSFSVTLWFLSSSLISGCTWNYQICCFLWWFSLLPLWKGSPLSSLCHQCITQWLEESRHLNICELADEWHLWFHCISIWNSYLTNKYWTCWIFPLFLLTYHFYFSSICPLTLCARKNPLTLFFSSYIWLN